MNSSFKVIRSNFKKYLSLYKKLLADSRTPKISKILITVAIGYMLMPFDLIPDFIPILGQLDDLIIVPGLLYFAIRFIPKDIYEEHKNKIFNIE